MTYLQNLKKTNNESFAGYQHFYWVLSEQRIFPALYVLLILKIHQYTFQLFQKPKLNHWRLEKNGELTGSVLSMIF